MARISTKIKMTPARKKQLIMMGVVMIFGFGVSMIWSGQSNNAKNNKAAEQKAKVPKAKTTDFAKTDNILSDRSAWQNSTGAEVDELKKEVAELKLELQNKKTNQLPNPNDPFGNGVIPPPPPNNGMAQLPDVGNNKTGKNDPKNMPDARTSRIVSLDIGVTATQDNAQVNKGGSTVRKSDDFQKKSTVARVKGIRPNIEVYTDGGDVTYSSSAKFRMQNTYVPSGTFFRVVLLGGVDAPTGGEAATANPHPVLMRVADIAQLPNMHRLNIKECFVLGTAYGDISAERAYIRTERMSCVDPQGRAIDMKIKGWVTGEDGKAGMRGKLVTKQGQMIANALMISIISGAGKGLAETYKTTSTGVWGTTSSTKAGDEFKSALAQSAGDATDRIAQYYIKLAEKTFPVVEINAGRNVDVVLLEGIQINPDN